MSQQPRIKPLDPTVVNRIAAGEIIVAPVNALKEMLENSIDAGATVIEVMAKEGGVKLLQITDNGSGIQKEDLPILCQRFTTSKLTTFEDLSKLDTYGFRGEALASISHIAHLTVTTKTNDSPCAWKAHYSDGELIPLKDKETKDPKPVAGKQGTTLTIEDFFYNIPSRLRALRSAGDEFTKILDVIGRYAIHCGGVGFSCKKFGDSHYFITTRPNLSIKERIRVVFGSPIANEVVPIEITDGFKDLGVISVSGQITNQNFNNKKSIQPVFFINNRLVSNDTLKRALYSCLARFLPKGHKPFIYLSLMIDPKNLDVNVHPTKREVRFLNEDEIIDKLCLFISEEFLKIDASRNFQSKTLMDNKKHSNEIEFSQPTVNKKPKYEYNLVRVDSSQSKITTFMSRSQSDNQLSGQQRSTTSEDTLDEINEGTEEEDANETSHEIEVKKSQSIYDIIPKERTGVNLKSISELRLEVESQISRNLIDMFSNLTYIGIVDSKRRLCSVQCDVKLLLIDYGSVLNELFYQLGLINFGNFGEIQLHGSDEELSISSLLSSLYEDTNFEPLKSIEDVIKTLEEMSEMFEEYFNIKLGNGKVKSLPLLLKNYNPPLNKLSLFLYRLATKVDYEDEKACLQSILKQLSLFYIPLAIPEDDELAVEELNESLENVLIPQIKRNLLAPSCLKRDIVEIANLPGLYKVFERC